MPSTKLKNLYILFGPPGSGKSTQALFLQEKLGLSYVSWGQISREIMNNHGSYRDCYEIVKKLTEENKPFPNGFIARILDQEIGTILKANEDIKGILLDGFPRRVKEAKELADILKNKNLNLKAVIKFNVNYETIKQRIEERMYCPKCGRFYNKIIKPKASGVCDADGSGLIKRPDDYLEIIENRFNMYMEESIDAFAFLVSMAEVSFDVNADQDEVSLFAEIITKINTQTKKSHHIYRRTGQTKLQTEFGEFTLVGYQDVVNYGYHLVLVKGDLEGKRNVPVRIHSSCITGDIFHSQRCDCGEQLQKALRYINQRGFGVLIYLFQEGRGINIINKIKAYELQANGLDTIEANEYLGFPPELREYDVVKDIISDLQIRSIDVMTNNPEKMNKLQSLGVMVENRIPVEVLPNQLNEKYLRVKAERLGHFLTAQKEQTEQNSLELEIKFLLNLDDVLRIKKRVLKIPGAFYEGIAYEKTTMLDNKSGWIGKDDARLRVRQISDRKDSSDQKIEFSYKRRIKADGGIKQEEEIETPFSTNANLFFKILNKMGYEVTTSYERYRETYRVSGAKVTVDRFPFGYILEVEGGEFVIKEICSILKFSMDKSYSLSCDDAYVELCKQQNIKPKNHILFDDPDMPQLG